MNEPELRNCPHCGGFAKQRQVPGSFGGYGLTEIACKECGATAPSAEVWNRRDIEEWPPGHETIYKKRISFGGPRTGGKTFTTFLAMLRQIDPEIADMFVKAWKKMEEEDESTE